MLKYSCLNYLFTCNHINNFTVNKTLNLKANPAKVWDALTKSAFVKQYFFSCEIISDWLVGSSIVYKSDHTVHVQGTITKIVPGEFLEYSYLPNGEEDKSANYAKVSWELVAENGGTILTITQGKFWDQKKYNESEMGWDYVIKGLKVLLQK